MVFVHARRPADLQLGWVERRARRVRVGLALLRVRRLSGVARAGARGAPRTAFAGEACRSCGGHPAARQHTAVRRADIGGDGNRGDTGGCTDRRDHRVGRGRRTHPPRGLRDRHRTTCPRVFGGPTRYPPCANKHELRATTARRSASDSRGVERAGSQSVGIHRNRRPGYRLRSRGGPARVRGRGCARARRRQRRTCRTGRARYQNAGHRTRQSHLPVHPL